MCLRLWIFFWFIDWSAAEMAVQKHFEHRVKFEQATQQQWLWKQGALFYQKQIKAYIADVIYHQLVRCLKILEALAVARRLMDVCYAKLFIVLKQQVDCVLDCLELFRGAMASTWSAFYVDSYLAQAALYLQNKDTKIQLIEYVYSQLAVYFFFCSVCTETCGKTLLRCSLLPFFCSYSLWLECFFRLQSHWTRKMAIRQFSGIGGSNDVAQKMQKLHSAWHRNFQDACALGKERQQLETLVDASNLCDVSQIRQLAESKVKEMGSIYLCSSPASLETASFTTASLETLMPESSFLLLSPKSESSEYANLDLHPLSLNQ